VIRAEVNRDVYFTRVFMQWLNYHHFLYFWLAVREGGLVPASRVLRLAHPTLSGQIRRLEEALGEKLFDRSKRRLELTEVGRLAYGYADEIFSLGQEFLDVLKGHPPGRPVRLEVGVTDVMPKLVVRRLLEPAFSLPERVQVVCREDRQDRLLAELALHHLDVVLAEAPVAPASNIRAFNHLLGESTMSFFAAPALARRVRPGFPESLDGAPLLMPTDNTALRRSIDQWLSAAGIRPQIVAEFEDSALLHVFAQDGLGVFCAPSVLKAELRRQHGALVVGHAREIRERYYAISIERRIVNPAVAAICDSARESTFE
jgi:LysR family transcriptional activator of nhaA